MVITVSDLIFEYPGIRALDGVSFDLAEGSTTALIGPNGAGKTTLLRCIAGLDTPLSGAITVAGIDVAQHPRAVHALMGFLYDFYGLYDDLTVTQVLTHRAGAQGITGAAITERVERAIALLGLSERKDQKVGTLSRGWRQRVSIALNVVHRPKILLLDEPASGLDPVARAELSAILRQLNAEGMTIVVSSHILSELEDYSTHMLALDNGRVTAFKALDEAETAETVTAILSLAAPVDDLPALLEGYAALVAEDGRRITLTISGDPAARPALLKHLLAHDVPVLGLETFKESLSDSYLKTTQKPEGAP